MKKTKKQRLIDKLENGHSLSCLREVEEYDGKTVLCMAFIKKENGEYVVSIEVFFLGNDLYDQNIRNSESRFKDIEDTIDYIKRETGLDFIDFSR